MFVLVLTPWEKSKQTMFKVEIWGTLLRGFVRKFILDIVRIFFDFRQTALHVAAFVNNLAATKTLLANNASPTIKDVNKM